MYKLRFILITLLTFALSAESFCDEAPAFGKMTTMGESRIVRTRFMIVRSYATSSMYSPSMPSLRASQSSPSR